MITAEDHDSIETLKNLTESWKETLRNYREAMASSSLEQSRKAEAERRILFAELRAIVDRLRAEHPQDAGLRAAWEQLYQVDGFLLFATAETITPYLQKLIDRSSADWQPLARGTMDGINPRLVHKNWLSDRWPDRLLGARHSQTMTQKEAAHECGVGQQTFERWERGQQPPAVANVPKVLVFIQSSEEKAGLRHLEQQPTTARE